MLHFNIIRNPELVLVSLSCTTTALECPSAPVFDFLQMQVLIKVLTPTFALFTDLSSPNYTFLRFKTLRSKCQLETMNPELKIQSPLAAKMLLLRRVWLCTASPSQGWLRMHTQPRHAKQNSHSLGTGKECLEPFSLACSPASTASRG